MTRSGREPTTYRMRGRDPNYLTIPNAVTYRIQSNYRPCPHNRPSLLFTLFSLIIAHFFLILYFIFIYYRPLDDLLALVVEKKFA